MKAQDHGSKQEPIALVVVQRPPLFTRRWQQADVSHKYFCCCLLDERGDRSERETGHRKASRVKQFFGFAGLPACWPASPLQRSVMCFHLTAFQEHLFLEENSKQVERVA